MHYDSTSPSEDEGAQKTAIEHLIKLKQSLLTLDTELFWSHLMEDIASISKAQYNFVVRRTDREEAAPELTDRRSSLLGTVFYYNDGSQNVRFERNTDLTGKICLLHMDDGRPCIVPGNPKSVLSSEDDHLPFLVEACLAIPLFSAGKRLAYCGFMWSPDRTRSREIIVAFPGDDFTFCRGRDCTAIAVG